MPRARTKGKWNPFAGPVWDPLTSTITVGAEASDVINVAVQLKNPQGSNLSAAARVRGRLCTNAAGLVLANPTTGGLRSGTNGVIVPGTDHMRDGLIGKGTLAIDVVPEKFKTTTTATFRINGVTTTKAAATAIAFSAAHVVAATKYGIVLVQVDNAGTVSTKVPAATATTPMTYATAALALAALPQPDANKIALGYITLDNSASDGSSAGAWTGTTDDLTNTSDITAAAFVDATEQKHPSTFEAVTNATGAFDLNIYDTAVGSRCLILDDPFGAIKASGIITFA